MHVGIAGEVRCVVTKADGAVKFDTGYQKNLILNQGLEFFGGGKGNYINASCAIGSGNSAPEINQTALDAYIAQASGTDITSSYAYVDKGDNLYRMWEQKKYRFTGLADGNISEVGLVSTGTTSTNYYLTTRALIKDSSGAPTSISVKTGEVLDVYYKIHKVIDTRDKAFVINMSDGNGEAVPYNVVVRPAMVGDGGSWSVSRTAIENPGNLAGSAATLADLTAITSKPSANYISNTHSNKPYIPMSNKLIVNRSYGLNDYVTGVRTIVSYSNYFFSLQVRFGSVANDSPIPKTNKDTLTIPLEISWGRYEGTL